MLCDILIEDARWREVDFPPLAEAAARNTLVELDLKPDAYLISVLACDDNRIAALNGDFRQKPTPTNVLSWPSQVLAAEGDGGLPAPPDPDRFDDITELGDIAIAFDTCLAEARAASKPLDQHVTHLVVHGVLHLLGYDHIRDKDATLMEGIETTILGKMGLPDPYREDHGD